jgi:uncharacterized protein YjbJ (UPF0337 family)
VEGKTNLAKGESPTDPKDVSGRWELMKGEAKRRWGDLTDDDLTKAEGNKDRLVGALRERYGYTKERAETEVDEWMDQLVNDIRPEK